MAGSGVPVWGPGPRATLAAKLRQNGGHLSRAQEELGVLPKTREVEGPGTKATVLQPRNLDSKVSAVGWRRWEDSNFELKLRANSM